MAEEVFIQRLKNHWSIEQIISGGQTGADRAALDWAIRHNIPHGGWCPQGRLAEDGVIDSKYTLKETQSSAYEERTERNVRDADGTVILTIASSLKGGSWWTLACAKKYQKPWLHVVKLTQDVQASTQLLEFIRKYDIRVLNIAGSRESEESDVRDFVTMTLEQAYQDTIAMNQSLSEQIRAHVIVSGRVQGVGYRASAWDMAALLKLTGWVRNLRDGRVEAVFEGSRSQVEEMLRWCHQGPPAAVVNEVVVDYGTPEGLRGFEVARSR